MKHKGTAVAAAIGVALALGGHGHHHGHGLTSVLDSLQATPVSGNAGSSRTAWAKAFLKAIPEPHGRCNTSAVVAWETAEGGGFGNQAENNPLNINPGSAPWPGYPATGAWAFPDVASGIKYTVLTIRNGDYNNVLSALAADDNAQAVCDAIMASPWAASHYYGNLTANC